MLTQTYEDGDTVTYAYDNNGALAKMTDSSTGVTTTYYYDFTDRMMKYTESGTGYSHTVGYEYDTLNNLTQLVETINGTECTTTFTYDDDNRITNSGNGTTSVDYYYDGYGRMWQRMPRHQGDAIIYDKYTFVSNENGTTSAQIASVENKYGDTVTIYSYTYDDNGNITSVSDGANTTTYEYDSANQLLRENNQAGNYTHTWEYDNAGNILSRKEYAYTTGELGTPNDTVNYTYGSSQWGDLLTSYDGKTITSDEIGNITSDGTWTYSWEHGRQLASMTDGTAIWNYTYNADGMRANRTNGTNTYSYVYNGSQLSQMTVDGNTLRFAYDANGTPLTVTYNGTVYYYITNIQGDVLMLIDTARSTGDGSTGDGSVC